MGVEKLPTTDAGRNTAWLQLAALAVVRSQPLLRFWCNGPLGCSCDVDRWAAEEHGSWWAACPEAGWAPNRAGWGVSAQRCWLRWRSLSSELPGVPDVAKLRPQEVVL